MKGHRSWLFEDKLIGTFNTMWTGYSNQQGILRHVGSSNCIKPSLPPNPEGMEGSVGGITRVQWELAYGKDDYLMEDIVETHLDLIKLRLKISKKINNLALFSFSHLIFCHFCFLVKSISKPEGKDTQLMQSLIVCLPRHRAGQRKAGNLTRHFPVYPH